MKIGIIGLGLIGGSIYKDLSKKYDVIAVSKSQNGKNIYTSYDVLKDCDVVFVCSAINKTLNILDELEDVLPEKTIVTDVCSVKEFLCKKQRPYNFIPAHPMAGTEHKGYENSLEGLFKGKKWVITKKQEDLNDNGYLLELIEYLGAKPIFTTPEEHDMAAALVSHMPLLVAQALVYLIKDNPLALEMASSGFRDMTRLALSNEEMAKDIVSNNLDNIDVSLIKLFNTEGNLLGNYPDFISEIKQIRQEMF